MQVQVYDRFYNATLPISKKIVQRRAVVTVDDVEGKAAVASGAFFEVKATPSGAVFASAAVVPVLSSDRFSALRKAVGSVKSSADALSAVEVEKQRREDAANQKRSTTMKRKFLLKKAEALGIVCDETISLDQLGKMVTEKEAALVMVEKTIETAVTEEVKSSTPPVE